MLLNQTVIQKGVTVHRKLVIISLRALQAMVVLCQWELMGIAKIITEVTQNILNDNSLLGGEDDRS